MYLKRLGAIGAIAIAGSLVLAGCATNEAPTTAPTEDAPVALEGTLTGVGASAQGAAQEGLIAAFQTANPGVTINYSPDGSGAGREAFIGGGANFAGSDRAFHIDEIEESDFAGCAADSGIVELPLYISPIAIVFNLSSAGIDTLDLDADTVAGIFAGQITSWDAPQIAATNSGAALPALPITPIHRADDSGTQENFTDYLAAAAPSVWTFGVDGEWTGPAGESAQGSSGIVDTVTATEGSISFVDASRASALGKVSVKVGDAFVAPTAEGAAAVVDASPLEEGRSPFDLAIALDRTTTAAGAYPVTLISYLIGCEIYADPAVATLVSAYFAFIASEDGQAVSAESAGSAPISASLRTLVESAISVIS